jgi:CRP/FNR family transcriptional regulator, polysaccharide utilization system transcription regulator
MKTNNCIYCDRKTACFHYLSKDELALFNENKTTLVYRKGETIVKQGTKFEQVISFNAGLAKLNIEIDNKRNLLLGLLRPSEILAGPGMFADNRYTFSVTALIDSIICLIDADTFKSIFRSNEKFADSFLNSFAQRYIDTCTRFVSLTQKQMHGRVAEALIFLSDTVHKSDNFELCLSRQELADFTGMSKESISRVLREFNNDRIVQSKGRLISIRDRKVLIRIQEAG